MEAGANTKMACQCLSNVIFSLENQILIVLTCVKKYN